MPQTTHLGMVYTTYLWWNWWWFIPVLPTLLHSKPQLGMALFFVFHVFFMIQPAFLQEKMLETRKNQPVPIGSIGTNSEWHTGVPELVWRDTLRKIWYGLVWFFIGHQNVMIHHHFWKKLPRWGMPPLDKRNVFGLQKKYGSCSRSLNPVNVPFIFFSEIYGRMKNLWKYEMALAVRLGTMCRCSLGWSIVISVISIVYSESRLSHK